MYSKVLSSLALVAGVSAALMTTSAQAHGKEDANNPLVQQCVQQAQAKDGAKLNTQLFWKSNLERYVPNKPYRLTVSLQGEGNAFHNLSCQVDASGQVTYEGFKSSGMPLE